MKAEKLRELGKIYRDETDYDEAYRCFLEASLMDDPESVLNLGLLYYYGDGVEHDFEKAFHYFRISYDLSGKHNLWKYIWLDMDRIYEEKKGRDAYREYLEYLVDHHEWYEYITMGGEYRTGRIYIKDLDKTRKCYERALDHGVKGANEFMGELFFLGEGVEQNYRTAYEHFVACEKSYSSVKPYYLGEMFFNGYYVEKNLERAASQYRIIADSQDVYKEYDKFYMKAVERLREIESMTGGKR